MLNRLLLVLAAACVSVPAIAQTPEEIFAQGNAAYNDGRYAEAAAAYRTVLKYQIRDARLEYNLGNAEFRIGRLGPAILHFERAKRLAPTDADILANLAFARASTFDRVPEPELFFAVRWVRGVQDRVGPDRQAWAFLVLLWGIALVLIVVFSRPGGWSAAAGWTLAALILVAALVGASWHVTYERLEGRQLAVVFDDVVEVLAGPGDNNAALFTVHEGLTVEIRAERQDWLQVSLPNGMNGWIRGSSVGRV